MRIFFAGPLTELKNPEATKQFYVTLLTMAKNLGFECFWAFLNGTDPIKNPDVLPADVYRRDIDQLEKSDIVIAYVGEASTGTGVEIEHAHHIGKPVILLHEQGKRVSRMVRGCPSIKKEIVFSSHEDALDQLKLYLSSLK